MLPRYRQWLLNKGIKQRLGSYMVIRFLHCASSIYKNPTLPPSVESNNSLLFLYNGITGEFERKCVWVSLWGRQTQRKLSNLGLHLSWGTYIHPSFQKLLSNLELSLHVGGTVWPTASSLQTAGDVTMGNLFFILKNVLGHIRELEAGGWSSLHWFWIICAEMQVLSSKRTLRKLLYEYLCVTG